MTYQQFSVEEREKIQEMLWQKRSFRAIAEELGRSSSSISREVKRVLPAETRRYNPRLAHERAMENRKKRGREERLKNETLREYVVAHLKFGWSPEQSRQLRRTGRGFPSRMKPSPVRVCAGEQGRRSRGTADRRTWATKRWKRISASKASSPTRTTPGSAD